jgi:hypothetical protein
MNPGRGAENGGSRAPGGNVIPEYGAVMSDYF